MQTPVPPPWRRLSEGRAPRRADAGVRPGRVYAGVVAATLAVLVAVSVLGAWAARREGEAEGVAGTARRTEILADAVVEPALTDGVLDGDPAALTRLDEAVRSQVLGHDIVRTKLWAADGTIVYSDEERLVGEQYDLDTEEREAIAEGADGVGTGAEISDLEEPENVYERGQGRLLEVYHPVRTPDGEVLLFETYAPYSLVTDRGAEIWRGFAAIVVVSLVGLVLLLLPIFWRLLGHLRRGRDERELLLQAALDASDAERRRIAATLHDGPVQELAATSYVVSGAASRAAASGDRELATSLDGAADAVRAGIGGLRSLLVDIYPASLDGAALEQALTDLGAGLRGRDVAVRLDVDTSAAEALDGERAQLIFGVARETLRNAATHACCSLVEVSLTQDPATGHVVLRVADDGRGFDLDAALDHPEPGHFGLRLLMDAASAQDATLDVATGPTGTTWCLEVAP
ncbi:histidine kinase [uncultured Nocardioides sp.]|uniref:sensor histidine kinase n=1 Tax=uncultured Nocardioides sp. TaxID=198441 RepID=UPI00260CDF04|nr:histidine kinase [uncultured Nocardioides sp.]